MASVPRPLIMVRALREIADDRALIDYEATRRARAQREHFLQYADWIDIGAVGAPAFENGWANATMSALWEPSSTEPRNTAGYFRDRWGFVHLKGVVSNAAFSTAAIFTLPVDLRPAQIEVFHAQYKSKNTFAGVYFQFTSEIEVAPTGIVRVRAYYITGGMETVLWASIDDISFRAANAGDV